MDEPRPTIFKKIKWKWAKSLILRTKTIKLLEEDIGENILDSGFSSGFLSMTPKAQATKRKIDKL